MRVLAIVLALAALGSLAISLTSHRQTVEFDPGPADALQVLSVYSPPEDAYDGMRANDARLWLGIAIAFTVSAGGVGVVAVRQRRQARPTGADPHL